jgi:hypothetical protein
MMVLSYWFDKACRKAVMVGLVVASSTTATGACSVANPAHSVRPH